MDAEKILDLVIAELKRAEVKHPYFPDDAIHAAAILSEESGELIQAAYDYVYKIGEKEEFDKQKLIDEAVQCAAMGIRFLMNVERLK